MFYGYGSMFYGYGLYMLFALPALLLGLYAQYKVQRAFAKWSNVRARRGITGAQAARRILDAFGLYDVQVEEVSGFLTDHYDPLHRVLRLSPKVYRTPSIAAVGVAAHETGHALQHAKGYWPLQLRSAAVPSVQIGSWLGPVIFIVGLLFNSISLAWMGVILFSAVVVFALITLPVELDASARAKRILAGEGILEPDEMKGVREVLNAAALTYVAAAIQALSTLLYYVFILSSMSRSRD